MKLRKVQKRLQARIKAWQEQKGDVVDAKNKQGLSSSRHYQRKPGSNNK